MRAYLLQSLPFGGDCSFIGDVDPTPQNSSFASFYICRMTNYMGKGGHGSRAPMDYFPRFWAGRPHPYGCCHGEPMCSPPRCRWHARTPSATTLLAPLSQRGAVIPMRVKNRDFVILSNAKNLFYNAKRDSSHAEGVRTCRILTFYFPRFRAGRHDPTVVVMGNTSVCLTVALAKSTRTRMRNLSCRP